MKELSKNIIYDDYLDFEKTYLQHTKKIPIYLSIKEDDKHKSFSKRYFIKNSNEVEEIYVIRDETPNDDNDFRNEIAMNIIDYEYAYCDFVQWESKWFENDNYWIRYAWLFSWDRGVDISRPIYIEKD